MKDGESGDEELVRRILDGARGAVVDRLEAQVRSLSLELSAAMAELEALRGRSGRRVFEVRVAARERVGSREAYRIPEGANGVTHVVVVRSSPGEDVDAIAADVQGQLGDSVMVVAAPPGTEVSVAELVPAG